MVVRRIAHARLIAVDGTSGRSIAAVARRVAGVLRGAEGRGGVSTWDSSGIFTELAAVEAAGPGPSARTLMLLYAADLAFRLRWQIRPALAEGQVVIAAPYVQSAMALGIAAGLPKRWMADLFRFAPKPHVCYLVSERRRLGPTAAADGYPEFFWDAIAASGDVIDRVALRRRSITYLDSLARRHACMRLTARALAGLGRRRLC